MKSRAGSSSATASSSPMCGWRRRGLSTLPAPIPARSSPPAEPGRRSRDVRRAGWSNMAAPSKQPAAAFSSSRSP